MNASVSKIVFHAGASLLYLAVLTAPAHGQNGEIYIIEAGTVAESADAGPAVVDISDRLGEQIVFEIFVRQIGPEPLTPVRGMAANFPCVVESGISGSVEYVRNSGYTDQIRDDFFVGSAWLL